MKELRSEEEEGEGRAKAAWGHAEHHHLRATTPPARPLPREAPHTEDAQLVKKMSASLPPPSLPSDPGEVAEGGGEQVAPIGPLPRGHSGGVKKQGPSPAGSSGFEPGLF